MFNNCSITALYSQNTLPVHVYSLYYCSIKSLQRIKLNKYFIPNILFI